MILHPFRDGDTSATFRNVIDKTVAEIEALENDYALNASPVELEQYYVSKVLIAPLTLDAGNHYIESRGGAQIDVSHDIRRAGFGGERILISGTLLRIAIPFDGDRDLWRLRASTYSVSGYPELEVRDSEIPSFYHTNG